MSTAGIFAVGVVVTLIVGTAMGLLVYGLVLERRDELARRERETPPGPSQPEDAERRETVARDVHGRVGDSRS